MAEVTVTCGCGRRMYQRGIDPKGTLRCGCGACVHVKVQVRATCFWLTEAGASCRFPPVREAAQQGLSLCAGHYETFTMMREAVKDGDVAHQVALLADEARREARQEAKEAYAATVAEWNRDRSAERAQEKERRQAEAVIYYIRIGEVIKIGTTANMKGRMSSLMPDEILATEPGGFDLEKLRHQQFRSLRIRGERFRPEPELLSHIKMIREHFGEPVMTGCA